jgi:hypothetical protein
VRYWVCVIAGLLIAGASIVLVDIGIYHLVRTGTCGSTTHYGTTYSARPCPPGTGLRIVSVVGGVFGSIIGIGLFAARGGRRIGSTIGLGLVMWSLLFITIPLSIVYAAYGPANKDSSGAKTTAIILSAVFIPMGLAPLPLGLRGRRKRDLLMQLATQGQRCPGVLVSVDDTGVTVNALHPASLMDTKMVQSTFGYSMSTVEEGTEAVVRLAISPEIGGVTGRYFDGTREARANRQAYDPRVRNRLWVLSEELCGRLLEPVVRR